MARDIFHQSHNHNHSQNHSHIHDHSHTHSHNKSQGNLRFAFFLNLTFTILEIAGGIWTNSMAILSDALHDLGDSLSLGVAWYLENFSKKGSDQRFSYGYARFSLLGALLNSMILVGGSVLILIHSIPRILSPEKVNSTGMLIFAVLGITMNGLAALRLRRGSSLNEKVVLWHLLEDVLGWAAVLVAGVILIFIDIPVIDPILSVLITCYVLYHVVKNLKETMNILLQGVPENLSITELENEIVEKTGVKSAYHTHIWSLDGEKNLLSTHIVVNDDAEYQGILKIKNRIREITKEKGIDHVTIEVDYISEEFDY